MSSPPRSMYPTPATPTAGATARNRSGPPRSIPKPPPNMPTGRTTMKSGGNVSSCGTKKMKAGGVMARVMNQKGKKK